MANKFVGYYLIAFFSLIATDCKQIYDPPAIKGNTNFLVVEGFVNSGQDSTTFVISRARNLTDTTNFIPEVNALVLVEGRGGSNYFIPSRGNGIYSAGPLNLNTNEKYRLLITTLNGTRYESDYVDVKQTPPIDSLSWKQDNDVTIYANTHDPSNNSWYYRWNFVETWEYHAYYDSNLGFRNGQVYFRDSSELLTFCWSYFTSNEIILGTSTKLSQDIIDHVPITIIPRPSEKIGERYSILVNQYALTQKAFEYWQLLKKNSKDLGTIFGNQPSQLMGNIHSTNDPAEPVIGYFSISSVEQKRIFIKHSEVSNWRIPRPDVTCQAKIIAPGSVSFYLMDTSYAPAYYVTGGGVAIAKNHCVDCTRHGGTTRKPPYW